MKLGRLDGRQRTKRAVIRKLGRDLGFPVHTADNLDALFDVLSTDVEGPLRITWRCPAAARDQLGRDYDRLCAVLRGVAAERPDMQLTIS